MGTLLIYGSYGYTGRLVAREAVDRGLDPVLSGRDGERVAAQADELGLEGRTATLEGDLESHLADVDAVLHCAGPFVETAEPMVEACLETGTDYLDITGELRVFERLRRRDEKAREAGAAVLPGVGFEIVPTDCLAAFLAEELPTAEELALGVKSEMTPTRGTVRTTLGQLGAGSVVRRNDRLVKPPAGSRTRTIDFGDGPESALAVPLGDVVTAAHTTGIGTVAVYVAAPGWAARARPLLGAVGWLLDRSPVERLVDRAVEALPAGPSEEELATDEAIVWGEVTDGDLTASARLRTPNPYALTAETSVAAATAVLDGEVEAGFHTPAEAFGPDFVLEFDGTERQLLESPGE